jgi:hypothetical protein
VGKRKKLLMFYAIAQKHFLIDQERAIDMRDPAKSG